MTYWQIIGIGIILIIILLVLLHFLSRFKTKKNIFYPLFLVLILFSAGFMLRLSTLPQLIDFGFFLTEISFLFTYILFTAVLILGQKKYWKIA